MTNAKRSRCSHRCTQTTPTFDETIGSDGGALAKTWQKRADMCRIGPAYELVGTAGEELIYRKRVEFLEWTEIVSEAAAALRDDLACHGVRGEGKLAENVDIIKTAFEEACRKMYAAAAGK